MKQFESHARVLPRFITLLMSALVAACGGGGSNPTLGAGSVAVLAPTVAAVTPLPNVTGLPVNTKIITASFSKAMDATTLTAASLTLACPVGTAQTGTVGYAANGNLATLTLTSDLSANTLCTATISHGAKDIAGVALAGSFTWTFSTGAAPDTTAPTVSGTIHANGATNVSINTKIGATFSEVMDPLTMTNANFTLKEAVTGVAVAGTVSYVGLHAVFIPASNLGNNTKYTVTVKGAPSGVKDVRGNLMASDFVISWTTSAALDTTAPTVIGTIHTNGQTNVAIDTEVGATFSEGIDPLTITNVNFTLHETVNDAAVNDAQSYPVLIGPQSAGLRAQVAGTVSYSGVNAVFIPLRSLAANTSYTATLKGGVSGVTDLAGNPLASDYVWSWTTAAVPVVQPTVDLGSVATAAAPPS